MIDKKRLRYIYNCANVEGHVILCAQELAELCEAYFELEKRKYVKWSM